MRQPMLAIAATTLLTLGAAAPIHAKLTTLGCEVLKHKTWDSLRRCQRVAEVKKLLGKTSDAAKCDTKFHAAFAKIDDKAAKAVIACRYRENGDGTVTDFDTGLQWEQKSGFLPFPGLPGLCAAGSTHCVNERDTIAQVEERSTPGSADGATLDGFLGGFTDWRLPTVLELATLLSSPYPCTASPCIDPVFAPTVPGPYWSATPFTGEDAVLFYVDFKDGRIGATDDESGLYFRIVRTAL